MSAVNHSASSLPSPDSAEPWSETSRQRSPFGDLEWTSGCSEAGGDGRVRVEEGPLAETLLEGQGKNSE